MSGGEFMASSYGKTVSGLQKDVSLVSYRRQEKKVSASDSEKAIGLEMTGYAGGGCVMCAVTVG